MPNRQTNNIHQFEICQKELFFHELQVYNYRFPSLVTRESKLEHAQFNCPEFASKKSE
jgi:hypothetical protein